MNISAENDTITFNKRMMDLFNPGSWSIKWKARLNFLLRAIVAIGLIILLVFFLQKKNSVSETNNRLMLLSDAKSRYIENYFTNLRTQVRNFTSGEEVINYFTQFSETFKSIESDNYLTSESANLDQLNSLLESFYSSEIIPVLNDENAVILKNLLPADNKQRILQYLYIAGNTRPLGSKGAMFKASDASSYSLIHAQFHPEIYKFARQTGVDDILFVDYETGYVTYSVEKNIDFATNLYQGPYKNSGLGLAFKKAIAKHDQGLVSYTDASLYVPTLYQPRIFLSLPVMNGTQILGAVIFAISNTSINNLLTYEKDGISETGTLKSIIIGDDLFYRCDDPEFIEDKKKYAGKLKRNAYNGESATGLVKFGTTSLIQAVDAFALSDINRKKEGLSKYSTETGAKVLCYYEPLNIGTLNWTLITQINKNEALAPLYRLIYMLFGITLIIAVILYYMAGIINDSLATRLEKIRNSVTSLVRGERINASYIHSGDEIGIISKALYDLNKRINETTNFITELSNNNIDVDFPVNSENDIYGISINNLKKSLVNRRQEEETRKREEEIRNWNSNGIAMFNDILRTDTNNLEKLSYNIIKNLVIYLKANQGGLFLIDGEEEGESRYLNLIAAYAYDRQKYLKKRIEIGEGLAGMCVLEKKTVLTNKIPGNYISITSGLGGATPSCLLIVPLKKEEEVLGLIEIASFEDLKPYEIEFIEKVAESIATALITVKLHIQTSEYLERFQQQAEEMKAQDEELRQNIEELQATHELMERLKQEENERNQRMIREMEDFKKLLISVINEVPEKIFLKDDKGRFIIANKPVADNYDHTIEEILGKSDFDFYSKEKAYENLRKDQEIIKSGETIINEEGDPSKTDERIVRTIKKPFYIEHLGVTGIFGVEFDITDIKRKEFEANKLSEDILQKQKEVEKASVELKKETALLDALLSSVPELIYFKDRKSKFLRFSKSMLKHFNLNDPKELIGKSDFDFFSKEHAGPAFEDEQNIIRTGKAIIDLEEKEVMEDGRVSWVNTTKMPLLNSEGEIIGTFGISKDITHIKQLQSATQQQSEELKSQEEELRQNLEEMMATQEDLHRKIEENEKIKASLSKETALLEALLNNIPESIYFKDKESKFIRTSRSMLKLFGMKKQEELIGKSDFDFFDEAHARPAFEDEQQIIRTGKAIIDLEEREVHKDGTVKWVNTTKMPLIDNNGDILGTFGISKDITVMKQLQEEARQHVEELKAQEEELRQNLEEMMATQEDLHKQIEENEKIKESLSKETSLLDALLKNIPELIYFKDKQSKFIRASNSLLKLFGLKKPQELIGKSDFDFFDEEHARPAYEDEQRIIKTGKAIIDLEEKEVHKDGSVDWVNTTKMPLISNEGEIIGTFGISKDITAMKMLQEEAKQHTEELKSQEEELRQNLEEMMAAQEDMHKQIEENERIKAKLSEEKALMDALLDNIPEHIYFKDKQSRFIRFSKSLLKLFGLKKPDELIGKSDFDFFSDEHARPAYETEQQIIKTGKAIIDLEEKEVLDDGRVNWVNTTKMPLKDSKGNIIGTFGISKTITRIKNLEIESKEKEKTIKQTEAKLEALKKEVEVLKRNKK